MSEFVLDPAGFCHSTLEAVVAHARRCDPCECVGLLLPQGTLPLTNVARDPHREFALDPLEVARALSQGVPVLGLYHSHPQGDLQPSGRDHCGWLSPGWKYWICDPRSGRVARYLWGEIKKAT